MTSRQGEHLTLSRCGVLSGVMASQTIDAWLERAGLGQYVDVFIDNDIDIDVVATLVTDDLKQLGRLSR